MDLRTRQSGEYRCGFCTEQVGEESCLTCESCGLRLHAECRLEAGPLCLTTGCGERTASYRSAEERSSSTLAGAVEQGLTLRHFGLLFCVGLFPGALVYPLSREAGQVELLEWVKTAAMSGLLVTVVGLAGLATAALGVHAKRRPGLSHPLILAAALAVWGVTGRVGFAVWFAFSAWVPLFGQRD